jgi:hypothetical protein
LSIEQTLDLWNIVSASGSCTDFVKQIDAKIKSEVDTISYPDKLVNFLWTLSNYKYYQIYTWNSGLKLLHTQLEESTLEDRTQIYQIYNIWCRFVNAITNGDEFKCSYYYKLYHKEVNQISSLFFSNLSQTHLESFLKSNPRSLDELITCFSNNYDDIHSI